MYKSLFNNNKSNTKPPTVSGKYNMVLGSSSPSPKRVKNGSIFSVKFSNLLLHSNGDGGLFERLNEAAERYISLEISR